MEIKKYIAGFAATGFVLIGFGAMTSGANAQASGAPVAVPGDENLITVQGTGKAKATPDIAYVSLGVVTQNVDAARASAENAVKSASLFKIMQSLSVADKDIQTTDYNIQPQYDTVERKPGDNHPPKIIAYQVSNTIVVTVRKIADVGKVLDAGVKAGANTAGDLAFDLNPDTRARAQSDALTQAFTDASGKATTLAQAAKVALFSVYSISEAAYTPGPANYAMNARFAGGGAETPIQAGELTISATITVKYRIRP